MVSLVGLLPPPSPQRLNNKNKSIIPMRITLHLKYVSFFVMLPF
jgi:hypothetical protein